MKLLSLSTVINYAFNYVARHSRIFNIDESHALRHSMDVYKYANKIYESEVIKHPHLSAQQEVIYMSAILHDMCDKKYMSETIGMSMIKNYMTDYVSFKNLNIIEKIISTMSYSKVKTNGYPQLDKYQLAYHIVREADLLTSYDFERTIIYTMYNEHVDYEKALYISLELFEKRVFKYKHDNLFITDYSKEEALKLHYEAIENIERLKNILTL